MLSRIGPTELLLVALVIFLLFGASRLPEVARSVGRSARILKSEARAMRSDDQDPTDDPPQPLRQEALPPGRTEFPSEPMKTGPGGDGHDAG
ncbi:twin-arginine translocase TatA/TatE family subunit [Streptomyces sp. NPDC050625]|uniref:twin-arginine translocase TatA/TatE family subunit n=1 Tax=Streptomyces sp. NPDC050625 TaxID=3154629 RepID=UPI00342D0C7C